MADEDEEEGQPVELVGRYKLMGDEYRTFPWADGALLIIGNCHQMISPNPVGHRHFCKFMHDKANSKAIQNIAHLYGVDNEYLDRHSKQVAIEVEGIEFVGFLTEDGNFIDLEGNPIKV